MTWFRVLFLCTGNSARSILAEFLLRRIAPQRFEVFERAFWQVAREIHRRLELFASLPFEKLDALRLEAATRAIAETESPCKPTASSRC